MSVGKRRNRLIASVGHKMSLCFADRRLPGSQLFPPCGHMQDRQTDMSLSAARDRCCMGHLLPDSHNTPALFCPQLGILWTGRVGRTSNAAIAAAHPTGPRYHRSARWAEDNC